jgi:hypothetical protein
MNNQQIVVPVPIAPSGMPTATIERAFQKFRDSVTPNDAIIFQSTTLEDVWKAAEEIEGVQRHSTTMRNMKRLAPFLHALDKYSKPLEILANGTPFLPWIWVSVYSECVVTLAHMDLGSYQINAPGKCIGIWYNDLTGVLHIDLLKAVKRLYRCSRQTP